MIAFVGRIDSDEQAIWLKTLSPLMPNERIVPFADLTDEERSLCDVAIVANPEPSDLLALPNLKWVQSLWAGVEKMMQGLSLYRQSLHGTSSQETSSQMFSVVRLTTPSLSETMSEAVLAWTLFLHRDMYIYGKQQAEKQWLQRTMVVAKDRRIGMLGLGALGKSSAQRLADNGFTVSGWSRHPKDIDNIQCFHGDDGLVTLLEQSDILVCLLPLTPETTGLLNQQTLSHLPNGASVINFARGPIIDDGALMQKLEERSVSHAVLDVFVEEPLPVSHPYWNNEHVTVLPHITAPTNPYSTSQMVAENILRYRESGVIPPVVDPSQGY